MSLKKTCRQNDRRWNKCRQNVPIDEMSCVQNVLVDEASCRLYDCRRNEHDSDYLHENKSNYYLFCFTVNMEETKSLATFSGSHV